ncbi:acyl-CoA dehydrogenase family protein [Microbacterium aurum]
MGVLDLSAYGLSDEERELAGLVRAFADERIAPQAYEADRTKTLPLGLVAEMGELGLFGLPFPEEAGGVRVGGQGGDYLALGLAIEAIARVDQSLAITLEAGVSLGAMPVYRFGTDAQRAELLPDLLAGRALAGFGLTEPEAGSDAGATRTTARLDGDEWVIDGAKQFITNSGTAITRFVTVTAVTGTREGRKEISTIIVPAGTAGFTVGAPYDKVGWHASDTHPLTFEGARVPAENLLGERGRGFANFLSILDEGRIAIAALSTGAAEGCLEAALDYADSRIVFGERLGSRQAIQFMLARMQQRVHTARLAWLHAARLRDAGQPFGTAAALAKLTASDAAMDNARDATQIFGGNGFMNEYPVARHYRDSKILEIGEGTSEVQLLVISRALGLDAGRSVKA